jgi:VCBS repeat protein
MHVKPEAVARRVGALAPFLAAALFLAANPARASIAADFNGDGVLDSVVLPRPPATNIVIQLSGSAPQILKLSVRIISVVAADIDHDGYLDLSVLTERRGLHVWLNKAGHGRFAALKKHRGPHGFGVSRGSQAIPTERGRDVPAAAGDQGGSPEADAPRAGPVFQAPLGISTVPTLFFTSSADLGKSTAPRGPPL